MDTDERKKVVTAIMEESFSHAKESKYYSDSSIENELVTIFSTSYLGFREIILVVAIAKCLNNNYKASENLYECKPRSLYENDIRTILSKYHIPRGKSGPLNIAKATLALNPNWASKRRPREAGEAVLRLVHLIEQYDNEQLKNFLVLLHAKFLEEAMRIEDLKVEIVPNGDPVELYSICSRLIDETPDAGNTPQRIVGFLLNSYHKTHNTGIKVENYEDSASTTNTTSQKPGDVIEIDPKEKIINIYEVTCKPFKIVRIEDSYQSIKDFDQNYGKQSKEVTVICREEDCPDFAESILSKSYLGYYVHKDIKYNFINIYEWIITQLLRMNINSRVDFYNKLNEYVSDTQTSEKVKLLWKEINSSRIEGR